MFAHEKFEIYNHIVSDAGEGGSLTYSPLVREAFLFCLPGPENLPDYGPLGDLRLSGVSSKYYPEKRNIRKVGYFCDQDFLKNILSEFESNNVATVKLDIYKPRLKRVLSNKQREEVDFFESRLSRGFGLSISNALEERFYFFNGMIGKYYKHLKEAGVDAVLIRVYYGLCYFPIIFACKMLGITVVDVQHGINGLKHPAYSRFRRSEVDSPLLPDVFWTWSEMATKMLNKNSSLASGVRIVEGGNPVLSQSEFSRRGRKILYTHQPQSKGIPVPYEEIKKVYDIKREKVVIRPHPLHIAEAYEVKAVLNKLNVKSKIEDSRAVSINDSLLQASVHVTHSSTCALDALNFGIPTVYCSDYIGEVEEEFSTGLLFKSSEIRRGSLIRSPSKSVDYSVGCEKKIRDGVKSVMSGAMSKCNT